MKLLEIKLFPLIRRKIVLDTTKEDFITSLEELRKESYMLFPNFSDGGKHKQYSLKLYSKFFILESLPKYSRTNDFDLFMTRIYGRYKYSDSNLTLTYYITFDIVGWGLFLLAIGSFIYSLLAIINTNHFGFTNGILMLLPNVLYVYVFNDESYGDKKFIERLIKANSKNESI